MAVWLTSHLMSICGDVWPAEQDGGACHWEGRAADGARLATARGEWLRLAPLVQGDGHPVVFRPALRTFPDVAPATDLVARGAPSGTLLSAVLHRAEAPPELRFRMTLPAGLVLEPMPSGALDVVDDFTGATVGRFLRPWTCDAMYRPVDALYMLDGPVVTLRLNLPDVAFPMVALVQYTVVTGRPPAPVPPRMEARRHEYAGLAN
ncbi:hypothetical protein [Actinomadura algeriensis]|uniref:Uncharacterized protein n=1 Tax=Actinomadura algeriensis TaxID=1679523 RepID=A0ABR9JT43_9ACTN|nr:hypothetical protein [Actinomadura algeriensis]MBE1533668.1 hypothetical protein [Actinomadura algeriensis]